MRVGELNLRVMEVLDKANTDTFGHPVPTPVRLHPRKGKAILISGHDLPTSKALLDQTAGTGIQIYTHGEMLPAHGYPVLKAIRTWRAITAAPGRTRSRNSPVSRRDPHDVQLHSATETATRIASSPVDRWRGRVCNTWRDATSAR